MFKKLLLFILVLVILIVGTLIAIPVIFKDHLVQLANEQASQNLNAEVSIGDVDLTFLSTFPTLTLHVYDVKVAGREPFDGIRLVDMNELSLGLDLMSVVSGDKISIKSIGLIGAYLHVVILPDGSANYDIAPPSEESEEAEEESSTFNLGIQRYYLQDVHLIYDDRSAGLYADIVDLDHGGRGGDFTQDDFLLETHTEAEAITYKQDGIAFLNKARLDMDFDIKMNLPNMRFEFDENYVAINALHLEFDGLVAMPDEEGEPIDLDMSFGTKETTFDGILSLVPGVYTADFKDVETKGNIALGGSAKGRMVGDQLPAFNVDLTVNEAYFHYPDLPKAAENIGIDLHVMNPGGSEDATVIDLDRLEMDLGGNPLYAALHMRTPISDPYLEATVNSDIDLGSLSDVIPLEEGQSLSGRVYSNIGIKAQQSDIDAERYERVDASGMLALADFTYNDAEMPYATVIKSCSLHFSPAYAELTELQMSLGKSDVSMTGRVDNIIDWYVADTPLEGAFTFTSDRLDLDELAGSESSEEVETDEEDEPLEVLEIPAGFNMSLNTSIKSMVYDGIEISNMRGRVVVHERVLEMEDLAMNMLGGSLKLMGSYGTVNPIRPEFGVYMDAIGWDAVETYEYLELAKKLAPIMAHANGKFSTRLTMDGRLMSNMDIDYNTLSGAGSLTTYGMSIESPKVLGKIAEALKVSELGEISLNNTKVQYAFEKGRVKVDPVKFTMGKEIPSVLSGSHGFDMTLDYVLNLDIPTKLMGSQASNMVSGLFSQANQALGTNASLPERVKVDVLISGPSDDPKVKTQLAGSSSGEGGMVNDLKSSVEEELKKQKAELEEKARKEMEAAKKAVEERARKEAEAAKKKAEQEVNKAKEEAAKKAEEAKKKAEEEAKKKAEEAKKKAEEEAKSRLNKLFK